jgi:hypothetical protein
MLQQHLAMTERHVALGEEHIAKQKALIAELERKGRDTVNARAFLVTLREALALHLEHRDRLLTELASQRPAQPGWNNQ